MRWPGCGATSRSATPGGARWGGRDRRSWDLTRAGLRVATQSPGLPAKKILFVSSNGWDAIGASWFAFTTLWVNRAGALLEQLDTTPTHTGRNLRAVLDFFPVP